MIVFEVLALRFCDGVFFGIVSDLLLAFFQDIDFEIVAHDKHPIKNIGKLLAYVPEEARADIVDAFGRHLVDEFMIDLEYAEEILARGPAEFQKNLEQCRPTGITDTIEELKSWGANEMATTESTFNCTNEELKWNSFLPS